MTTLIPKSRNKIYATACIRYLLKAFVRLNVVYDLFRSLTAMRPTTDAHCDYFEVGTCGLYRNVSLNADAAQNTLLCL